MQVDLGLLTFSFSAGVAAFFNPCGFALLPSYVAHYLGTDPATPSWAQGMSRGLALGGTMSLGFLLVFAALGVILSLIGSVIARYLPWASALIGIGLIGLGIFLFLGVSIRLPLRLEALIQRPLQRRQGGFAFYVLYGMSYALCSISCTIPIFIVVVAQAFSLSVLNGVVHFAAYGLGMAVMMLTLSVAMAVSKQAIARFFDPVMRWMKPLSATVMVLAGVYLIYYNLVYSGIAWR